MYTADEFWAAVEKSAGPEACWPWMKARYKPWGYGAIQWQKQVTHAHRVALLLTAGEPPEGKPLGLHLCDNPPCCNPRHLVWGNQTENQAQMWARGRGIPHGQPGMTHPRATLSDDDVRTMRTLYPTMTLRQIGERFQVHKATVGKIINRKAWRHI
jgi:hypothetical protein